MFKMGLVLTSLYVLNFLYRALMFIRLRMTENLCIVQPEPQRSIFMVGSIILRRSPAKEHSLVSCENSEIVITYHISFVFI